ncbi:MAG TPA: hypothetical protein VLT36_10585 [Candidatus Dormibacteraeota bacterium]|nr:hypothetical protein [Candidatus Dormibacteraeota bacterium]
MKMHIQQLRPFGFALLAIGLALSFKSPAQPVMPGGVLVRGTIDLNGNNLMVDSYDSSDLNKSWFGTYNPSWYAGDNGNVACGSPINSVSGGSYKIYGQLATGPGQHVTLGAYGGLGSHAWQSVNPGTIEPNGTESRNWYTHDANYFFPPMGQPYTSGIPLEGPWTFALATNSISSLVITTSVYPAQVVLHLTTNYTWFANTTLQPPPTCCLVTNLICATAYTRQTNVLPAPGTYCPGSVITNNNGMGGKLYDFHAIVGTNYTYAVATSYSYPVFTTNTVYFTNTYNHVLNFGDYYYAGTLSGKTLVLGDAHLFLPGGLNMASGDSITIAEGAHLFLWCGGTTCTVRGILNSAKPVDLLIFCLSSVSTLDVDGNSGFKGAILAPDSAVSLNGGGSSTTNDYAGYLIASSVRLNANFAIHVDDDLTRRTGLLGIFNTAAASLGPPTLSDGQYQFLVSGIFSYNYAVQASSDLLNWTPLSTNTSPFIFLDPQPATAGQKFYRAVWLP